MDEITLEQQASTTNRAKNENKISNVLNQEEFQHLGSQQQQQQQQPDDKKHSTAAAGGETLLGMVRTGSTQKMYQLQSQN